MLIACNVIEAFSRIPHCVGKEFISQEFKNVRSFGQIVRDRFKIVVRWAHYSRIHRRRRLVMSAMHQYVVIYHYAVRRSSAIARALPRELALRLMFADTQLLTSLFDTAPRDKSEKSKHPCYGLNVLLQVSTSYNIQATLFQTCPNYPSSLPVKKGWTPENSTRQETNNCYMCL